MIRALTLFALLGLAGCDADPLEPEEDPGQNETEASVDWGLGLPGKIAFVTGSRDYPFILVADMHGSKIDDLTHGDTPAWSSDGQRLAFHRKGPDGADGIYVIDADGSNERWLAAGTEPAWSPDHQRISFNGEGGIFLIDADGSGSSRKLLVPDDLDLPRDEDFGWDFKYGTVESPSWSLDGKSIAFVRVDWFSAWDPWYPDSYDYAVHDVYLINTDGSEPRLLTRPCPCPTSKPRWSPDGALLATITEQRLATLPADGTGPATIRYADSTRRYHSPDWSPDGRYIVLGGSYPRNPGENRPPGVRNEDLFVLRLDDGSLHRLLQGGSIARNYWDPSWAPAMPAN